MKDLPVRKNIRLKDYDYSSAGYYFITICVKDRHELLGKIDVGANCVRPCFSDIGILAEEEISVLSGIYENASVIKHVIMPNHIHMIIAVTNDGRTQFAPTISRVIKQFKGAVTKKIGYSIWQRSYHDHIICSEAEYQKIWRYIDENPERWPEDCYFVHP